MSGIRVYILRVFWLIPVGVLQVEYVSLAMETVPETMCRKHISCPMTIHITDNELRSPSVARGYVSWALPTHLTHRVMLLFQLPHRQVLPSHMAGKPRQRFQR